MSDTPRTDRNYIGMQIVPASFAQQLERELNAANQISKKYEDRYFECLERIKRLEKALDEVYHAGRVGASLRAKEEWLRAKEAKP